MWLSRENFIEPKNKQTTTTTTTLQIKKKYERKPTEKTQGNKKRLF